MGCEGGASRLVTWTIAFLSQQEGPCGPEYAQSLIVMAGTHAPGNREGGIILAFSSLSTFCGACSRLGVKLDSDCSWAGRAIIFGFGLLREGFPDSTDRMVRFRTSKSDLCCGAVTDSYFSLARSRRRQIVFVSVRIHSDSTVCLSCRRETQLSFIQPTFISVHTRGSSPKHDDFVQWRKAVTTLRI
ncbi:hypothetical protein L210DRAFT_2755970 [Boletus edulis BED1]|uniref:Uncharacterized protein n=1 Tax=Boletus edulis BED1 TaxID=1328754 RepID=A0AAD4BKV8_BOLED|nr:hypothetical protein L210DRAFT_2755970 [Boletus edulis BED1]